MRQDFTPYSPTNLVEDLQSHQEINPSILFNQIIELQSLIGLIEDHPQTIKKSRFFGYEIDTLYKQNPFEDKYELLIEYFFNQKHFKSLPFNLVEDSKVLSVDYLLSKRKASPLLLSIFFNSLAHRIGIELNFIKLRQQIILKYLVNGKAHFINIENSGSFFAEKDVLEILNKNNSSYSQIDTFKTLDNKTVILKYLEFSCEIFELKKEDPQLILTLYNLILQLKPSCVKFLKKRAILYYQLKNYKNSFLDIKKFSYLNHEKSLPEDLQLIYQQLQPLNSEI